MCGNHSAEYQMIVINDYKNFIGFVFI